MTPLLLSLLLAAGPFGPSFTTPPRPAAQVEPDPAPQKPPPPTDDQCPALPTLKAPLTFAAGETLDFDLDALGAQAGKMTMKVLAAEEGALPVEVRAQTNTFFSKVRRVKGVATSYLDPRTLRPRRYTEDATENEVHKTAQVSFRQKEHHLQLAYTVGETHGDRDLRFVHDGLDVAGAIYLMRQLPLKDGLSVCFDVYGIRSVWRLTGKVVGKEHASLPVGEFEVWHLQGTAVKMDDFNQQREVHVWITDDDRRLPIVAMGVIDLGAVRATLTAFTRPGERRARAEPKGNLKW